MATQTQVAASASTTIVGIEYFGARGDRRTPNEDWRLCETPGSVMLVNLMDRECELAAAARAYLFANRPA